jgi:DNA-binding response OmpR family regulator
MITTEGSEDNVVQALAYGARGYIRKPFTADEVREQILPILAEKLRSASRAVPTPVVDGK